MAIYKKPRFILIASTILSMQNQIGYVWKKCIYVSLCFFEKYLCCKDFKFRRLITNKLKYIIFGLLFEKIIFTCWEICRCWSVFFLFSQDWFVLSVNKTKQTRRAYNMDAQTHVTTTPQITTSTTLSNNRLDMSESSFHDNNMSTVYRLRHITKRTGAPLFINIGLSTLCVVLIIISITQDSSHFNDRVWNVVLFIFSSITTLVVLLIILIIFVIREYVGLQRFVHCVFATMTLSAAVINIVGFIGLVTYVKRRNDVQPAPSCSKFGCRNNEWVYAASAGASVFGFLTSVGLIIQTIYHVSDYRKHSLDSWKRLANNYRQESRESGTLYPWRHSNCDQRNFLNCFSFNMKRDQSKLSPWETGITSSRMVSFLLKTILENVTTTV